MKTVLTAEQYKHTIVTSAGTIDVIPILVFKNNYKFRMFVQNWEKFLWYSIQNDIRNYPDGFEIGVSALQAGMKWHYMGIFNHFLPSCFEFYTKLGDKHIRF